MAVLEEKDVMKMLEETKAVLHGHFLLTSGLHSPMYVENSTYCSILNIPSVCARKSHVVMKTTMLNW